VKTPSGTLVPGLALQSGQFVLDLQFSPLQRVDVEVIITGIPHFLFDLTLKILMPLLQCGDMVLSCHVISFSDDDGQCESSHKLHLVSIPGECKEQNSVQNFIAWVNQIRRPVP
jgi:hypothetical protein